VFVDIPWRAITAWDGKPVRRVKVHRQCAQSLQRVFSAIWAAANGDQSIIEKWGMHLYGGAYNYRPSRGSSRLSAHAYGAAIDFDPARNGMGDTTPNFASIPWVLTAFRDEGWAWGGRWSNPDGMHWEAVR
jgi:hypothetical protein